MEIEEQKVNNPHPHLLSDALKYYIIFLKMNNESNKSVSRETHQKFGRSVHPSTVQRIWEKYQQTQSITNNWSSQGRPTLLKHEDRTRIEEAVLEDRFLSCQEVRDNLELEVSRQTVQRELKGLGYKAYASPKKPLLSETNEAGRLRFAEEYEDWDVADWSSVIFTDESAFSMVGADGRAHVWRKAEEAMLPGTFQYTTHRSQTIQVWGAISFQGCGPLVLINGNLDGEGYLDLFRYRLRRLYPGLYNGDQIFQDDNAPAHRARVTNRWFEKYGITRLPWPSKSPDLNIIEDVWGHLKYQLRGFVFEDEGELWEELQNQWNRITPDWIQGLYQSLPSRIEAIINAEGGITKY